jgi:hypothetical protein
LKTLENRKIVFSGGRFFRNLLCLRSPFKTRAEKWHFPAALFCTLKNRKTLKSVKTYFSVFSLNIRTTIAWNVKFWLFQKPAFRRWCTSDVLPERRDVNPRQMGRVRKPCFLLFLMTVTRRPNVAVWEFEFVDHTILRYTSCRTPWTGVGAPFRTRPNCTTPLLLRAWSPDDGRHLKKIKTPKFIFRFDMFSFKMYVRKEYMFGAFWVWQGTQNIGFLLGAKHPYSFQDPKSWCQTEGYGDQIIKDANGPLVSGQLVPQVHTSLLIEWGLDRRYGQWRFLTSTGTLSCLRHVRLLLILCFIPFSGLLSRRPRKVDAG